MKLKHTILYIFYCLIVISCSEGDPDPAPILHPGNVNLVSPSNNNLCENGVEVSNNTSSVTFNWNFSENTESYDIVITNLDTNQESLNSSITSNSFEKILTKGHPYSWKVTSRNNESTQQGNSPTWNFYLSADGITNYSPFPAQLIYPENNQNFDNNTNSIVLDWIGSDIDNEDLIYTIYFDNVDGNQSPQQSLIDILEDEIEINVETNNSYFWKIKTSDGQNSSFSQIYEFHID
tara:strand:+ start:34 stop:738 length:705 start_codon:yes stop_codon:yes gene_type:complete